MTQFGRITKHQLTRLQTVYSQLARHTQESESRDGRLQWASELTGRAVKSFRDLSFDEARRLIDTAQGQLGVKAPAKCRRSGAQGRRAGLDGRHDGAEYQNAPQVASAADLATIESYYLRLGWNRAQFDAWLCSPRSPLRKRARTTITTTADANSVRWALKGMLVAKGLWVKPNAS